MIILLYNGITRTNTTTTHCFCKFQYLFSWLRIIGASMCILEFISTFTTFFSVFVLQLFVCVEIASLSRYSVHFTAFVLRFFCVECNPGLIFSSFVERVAAPRAVAVINPNALFTITNDKSYLLKMHCHRHLQLVSRAVYSKSHKWRSYGIACASINNLVI
jgi:hypothetical protein